MQGANLPLFPITTNPYDSKHLSTNLSVAWSSDIPGLTLSDSNNTTSLLNSELDSSLAQYTISALVSDGSVTVPLSLDVNRLRLYFSEERDASSNTFFRAILAFKYNTLPGAPNRFTGSITGSWQWYAGSLLATDQSYHEVTPADGFTVEIDPDGRETRLYGVSSDYIYKVTWTSDPASLVGPDGQPVEFVYEKSGINAPTEFVDLSFWSYNGFSMIFYANRHDLTINKGVTFKNFKKLNDPPSLGLMSTDVVPEVTIVAGKHDYDHETDDYVRPQNVDPYLTTVIIRSGGFARLIGAARNDHLNPITHNVTGTPTEPFRSHIVIDIDDSSNVANTPYYKSQHYSHDIGLIVGGQTDGSVWGDVDMEMHAGKVSRYISGNISFGRSMGDQFPDDSFFGRTRFSLYGGDIGELYGGSLGRFAASDQSADYVIHPYFYGTSIINIYGGTVRSNLYGAGAGGVMGIGYKSDTPGIIEYSPDRWIPYYDAGGTLLYGPYDSATAPTSAIPDVYARIRDYQGLENEDDAVDNFSRISLRDSHVEVNIHGGVIHGNVYGGGYGYSSSVLANRAPYGIDHDLSKIAVSGNLYGTTKVRMTGGTVFGNLYGAGAGSDIYDKSPLAPEIDFTRLALVFGDTDVEISGGTIGVTKDDFADPADITDLTKTPLNYYDLVGNVYGAGQGLEGQPIMATLYGNSNIVVSGGTVMGNAFAGGDFSNVVRLPEDPEHLRSGNAHITIDGGTLGNAIFGGSRGSIGENATNARIEGETFVTVNGGDFIGTPFINEIDNTHGYRSFNIYGGGYLNCVVEGQANVAVNHSLMAFNESFMAEGENPNEWPNAVSDFQRAYLDITYRHFCVYGGGFGEHTRVLNTDVKVYISTLLNEPHGRTLAYPYFHQSLFDIAGGGYSGDVGYWEANGDDPSAPGYDAYDHYVGGNCKVTIDGFTYARKVIGGGFYGSCYNSDITIKCGSLRQIYGGSLLGYVHGRARLTYGNRVQDFLPDFDGDYSVYTPAQIAEAENRAKALNKYLYVTENMYGGNDVKGIIGTTRWTDPFGNNGLESTDNGPLFAAEVDPASGKGIEFNIYGGTLMGDVYCAGNGHYRGYYVPEWVRYNDGPARMYSPARSSVDPTKTGYVYRARPMVGCVNVNIQGNNSVDDYVTINGDLFGGGRACTIGQWNTLLPFEDPRRLVKGGYLHMNLGSHIRISGGLYMGADGSGFNEQTVLPEDADIDLSTFDGSTTKELLKLGEAAYGHWFFNTKTNRYEPGYPEPGAVDGNYGFAGEHMLRGYLKNIEMPGDVELTVYKEPFQIGTNGKYVRDAQGNPVRKHWVPAERAITAYDSEDIHIHDFFLGGRCGSMTNNNVMHFDFGDGNLERYGAIYRVSLPQGITITNSAVMGSRDACVRIYPYNPDFKSYQSKILDASGNEVENSPQYLFEGGITTQSPLTYDIIAYNDLMTRSNPSHICYIGLPDDFYTNSMYASIRNNSTYTLMDGTVIKRKKFVRTPYFPNWDTGHGLNLADNRYDLAVTEVDGKDLAFAGPRETRAAVTAVKAGLQCGFALEDIADTSKAPDISPELAGVSGNDTPVNPYAKEGGLVYGGCYYSGITMGDVILLVASDVTGGVIKPENAEAFKSLSSLKYNIGRVFGAGFGRDARVEGNTYVNLLMDFRAMNVFGGGLGGNVTGSTTINYIGSEDSYIFGSIYGGALIGSVGLSFREFDDDGNLIDCRDSKRLDPDTHQPMPARATNLNLISGNVSRVFGGSCMADVYGSTNVILEDQAVGELDHLDIEQMKVASEAIYNLLHSRLIAGAVYGGNDVAGTIHVFGEDNPTTNVQVREFQKSPDDERTLSPGSADLYNGFPLIGTLYGGSNGDYGHSTNGVYDDGNSIELYLGPLSKIAHADVNGWVNLTLGGFSIPNIERTNLDITGGTIVSAYCGGNKATVTDKARATIDYSTLNARAGFDNTNASDDPLRIWNLLKLSSQEQFKEVLDHDNENEFIYKYQIYKFFSGNDNADMAIQPEVNLLTGHIGSVYGGGNNGRMTYWQKIDGKNHGVELTVNSPDIHIEALYGGGRMGDICALDPATGSQVEFEHDEYGATLNIYDGLIEAVYGGNDVCGNVYNGTNVNIYGAISGDVYGAGNGNYLYQLDTSLDPDSETIYEEYDDENHGGRYFRLPPKALYGGQNPSDAQKIVAINSYRPNVDKSYLNIHGSASMVDDGHGGTTEEVKRVWVKGSVFCGGNSSTIRTNTDDGNHTIRFNIGDYVTLNNVFLGSNGSELADTRENGLMLRFEHLNDLLLHNENDLTEAQVPEADKNAASHDHYPYLLSLYMRAVEVDGVPDDFKFDITKPESQIGNFCLGGNHGSMMTDKTIRVTLPETLTIFGNVIGGCYDTAFHFRDVLHSGGMTQFLNHNNSGGAGSSDVGIIDPTLDENNKVWLTVKCKFAPKRVKYPVDGDLFKITLEDDLLETNGKTHYGHNRCNIYGGCFNSGLTVGDIRIDLYSDLVEFANPQYVLNGIEQQVRALDVVGGGYGKMSMVIGDTKVRMLPSSTVDEDGNRITRHPSCAAIFGGSQEGQMVGNTFVSIRDGAVFTNVYGGSESALLRGSTNVVIGYPASYRCRKTGVYNLDRADKYSTAATQHTHNAGGSEVIKTQIWLREGDLVAPNVRSMVTSREGMDAGETLDTWFGSPTTTTPETFGATWDDIEIHVGRNNLYDLDQPYFGHGNVYGGGFISNNSDLSLAGQPTVLKFDDYADRVSHQDRKGYGGNAMIIIGDNPRNSDLDFKGTSDMALRDHISIGTACLKKLVLKAGENKVGKYYVDPTQTGYNRFIHQESGIITEQDVAAGRNVFYEIESDGGIYGGGRKVFVEGFRACDLYGYGYAEHTPQHPKHINTIQRIDLFTMRDCCMQLVGAPDYASTKIDATPYSMTRVGEFRMESSLDKSATLNTGVDLTVGKKEEEMDSRVDKPGYMVHNTTRSRNYMGFFKDINYVGAIHSSTAFDDVYHGVDGVAVSDDRYRTYKERMVGDRNDDNVLNFPRRNVATSHNMIGINNGYTLKVQGPYTQSAHGSIVDRIYYGPIIGVVEVKLLTLLPDEGGGYIYALNKHDHDSRAGGEEPFVETTGNFVFPGRIFSANANDAHYMYDDCYPMGYDVMTANGTNAEGWKDEEIHYWFVSGNSYFFNTTLTAYTYNHPKDFFLNNYDSLIMLSGVEADKSEISVKSVVWGSHPGDPVVDEATGTSKPYDCDLTNYTRTGNDSYNLYLSVDKYTNINHSAVDDESVRNGAYVARIPRANFDGSSATAADGVNPNSDDNGRFGHKVTARDNSPVVGITLHDDIDNSSPTHYKEHLSRPDHVTIELEARRPDENGIDIVTKYTINLTIIYLQGPNIEGNVVIDNCALPGEIVNASTGDIKVSLSEELVVEDRQWVIISPDRTATIDVTDYHNDTDYKKLELPVWFYHDGWDLFYRIIINGETFDIGTNPTSAHPFIEVHNYHRMKAMYGKDEIYQVLTPGSRIYIEDADDLDRFISLTDSLSMASHMPITIPGTSLVDRPRDCEGLLFFLGNDLTVPAGHTLPARFGGALYGNGYTLSFADDTPLLSRLTSQGVIRDTGFIGKDNGYVLNLNDGTFQNCFYFNDKEKGGFSVTDSPESIYDNCYQNASTDLAETYASTDDFRYGRVAYNLNGYYLKGRYDMLGGNEPDVPVLTDFYYNGDYRFARWDSRWGTGQPTALRTTPRPNYMNYERTGRTNHNMKHPEDVNRHVAAVFDPVDNHVIEPEHYKPYWVEDFLKFGQNLSATSTQTCPNRIADDTRVYRASGFYGSKTDRGFHFNLAATAVQPTLTAIDFTGYRDAGTSPDLVRTVNSLSDVFCRPMLDLPDGDDPNYGLSSLTVVSNATPDDYDAITRNLLIYTKPEATDGLHTDMLYTEAHDETAIKGHLLKLGSGFSYEANDGLLHLVDKQDFNAPIEFTVSKRAWYERRPLDFSTGDNAFEGICLPFAANRVSAFSHPSDFDISHEAFSDSRSHGEITHFYGDEQPYGTPNVYNRLHEYWLRSLAGSESDCLIFARPGMSGYAFKDRSGNPRPELTADYHYSNTWFTATYGSDYFAQHNQYTPTGVDFNGYRFLTADIPYIVGFPSKRYYEFDLSGDFYQNFFGETQPFEMTIRYEYLTGLNRTINNATEDTRVGASAALDAITIGVSDDCDHNVYAGPWTFTGTFMRRTFDSASAGVIDIDGASFRRASYGEAVLPFRAYLTSDGPISAPRHIAAPAADPISVPGEDDGSYNDSDIIFTIEQNTLVAVSPRQACVTLCDPSGRIVRMLEIEEGRNEFNDIDPGIYMAGRFKFYIR